MLRTGWLLLAGFSMLGLTIPVMAQVRVSATPVSAIIPTLTQPPTVLAIATFTPTWTPTPEAGVMLEVRADVGGEINVRSMPDTNSERLGAIKPGERYPISARYFRWLRLEFDGRSGWVFDELVNVTGDPSTIPDIDPFLTPTAVGAFVAAAPVSGDDLIATLAVLTLTPGAEQTFNAEQRVISIPTLAAGAASENSAQPVGTPLPTFTPPVGDIALSRPSAALNTEVVDITQADGLDGFRRRIMSGNIPPIAPILLLAVGGVLGLFVSALRR